jgi:hypothetical protein
MVTPVARIIREAAIIACLIGIGACTPEASRVVSTRPMAAQPDVVGVPGSSQDNLAREIYVPGSRPIGW